MIQYYGFNYARIDKVTEENMDLVKIINVPFYSKRIGCYLNQKFCGYYDNTIKPNTCGMFTGKTGDRALYIYNALENGQWINVIDFRNYLNHEIDLFIQKSN